MGVVKVIVNGTTKMDITPTTATAEDVASGEVFFNRSGNQTTGTSLGTGRPNIEDPVKFWDYDGTLLYSFTDAEALALTALPPNPSHTGLTAEGWNWTLADIKSYATSYPDGDINVGQTYITSSGDTELYVTLDSSTLHPYLKLAVNGTVSVDWGDNSTPSTMIGDSNVTLVWADHEYAAIGNYKITISVQSGMFTIYNSSSESNGLFSNTNSESIGKYYADILTKVLLGSNVKLSSNAFYSSYALNTVSISKTIDSLGNSSLFNSCYSLKHITFPTLDNSYSFNNTFNNCYNLISASIPRIINTASFSSVFNNCYSLSSITVPDNITNYNPGFCSYCYRITKIVIPDSVSNINGIFYNLYNLKKIITNKTNIESNQQSMFQGIQSLENIPFSITMTNSASTTKLSSLFYNMYSLKSIPTWSKSVGNITQWSNYVYGNCYRIKTAYIPSTITDLGSYTFQNCYCLESVDLPSNLTTLETNCFTSCYSLSSITIPNTVTSIGISCFQHCYSLSSITLSNTLQTLGNSCFYNCRKLLSITLPSTLQTIGNSCFYYCQSLTTITIPASVTSIGNSCFNNCANMQEYHFLRTTPPTLGTTAFPSISSGCKIYVPYSSDHSILNAYKTATNWSTYASYIEEEPQS